MNKNEKVFFSCVGMIEYDNKIWFSARETNGLFRMGLHGENFEYMGSFPNEPEDKTYLYGECVVYEEKIIFAPNMAQELAVYDMKKQMFQNIPLDTKLCNNQYLAIVKWNDEVFLLPAKNRNRIIVRINIKNGDIQYIDDWQNKFIIDDNAENIFFDYCIKENILYAPVISSKGQIMKYNLETQDISCIQMATTESYRGICCDGEKFYLCSQSGNELVIVSECFEKIDSKIISEYNDITIKNIFYRKGKVFLFTISSYDSMLDDMIIGYDVHSKNVQTLVRINSSEGKTNCAGLGRQFAVFCDNDSIIYSLHGGNGMLYEIDSINVEVNKNKVQRIDALPIFQEKYIRNNGNVSFGEKKDGSKLLDFLIKIKNNSQEKQEKNYGKKIWGKIRD